jgi:hypothetical protein
MSLRILRWIAKTVISTVISENVGVRCDGGLDITQNSMKSLSGLWWWRFRNPSCIVGTSSHVARLYLSGNHLEIEL